MKNNMSVAEQATLFPFTPPKHSDSLCIPVGIFMSHALFKAVSFFTRSERMWEVFHC